MVYGQLHNSQRSHFVNSASREDSFSSVMVLISAAALLCRAAWKVPLVDERRLVSVQRLWNKSNRKTDRRSTPEAIIILFVSRPLFCFIQTSAGLTRPWKGSFYCHVRFVSTKTQLCIKYPESFVAAPNEVRETQVSKQLCSSSKKPGDENRSVLLDGSWFCVWPESCGHRFSDDIEDDSS